MSRKKKVALLLLGVVIALVVYAFPTVRDLVGAGFLDKPTELTYTPGRRANLEALRTALLTYHRSEDAFPEAKTWVAEVEKRLKPDNMAESSALGKLTRPDLAGAAPGTGYHLNAAAAGKYKDDLDPATILVYETTSHEVGGAGDPTTDGEPQGSGITVGGEIVPLKR